MHVLSLLPLLPLLAISPIAAQPHIHRNAHAGIIKRQDRPNMTGGAVWGTVNPFATETATGTGTGTGVAQQTGGTAPEPSASVAPTSATSSTTPPVVSSSSERPDEPSVAPTTSALVSPTASTTSTSALISPSSSSALASSSSALSTSSSSASLAGPSTLSLSSQSAPAIVTQTISTRLSSSSRSGSAVPLTTSSDAAAESTGEKKTGGLSQSALIAIIVVASVVGAVGIGWTLFRKWKLRPSGRFDEKMRPIDFSPHAGGMGDDFLEKTLQRSASNVSADRQRQALVAELDHNHVPGVPEHDFTAGTGYAGAGVGAGVGAGAGYAYHSQAYDDYYQQQQGTHGYPPMPHGSHALQGQAYGRQEEDAYGGYDYPGQDGSDAYAHAHAQQGHDQGQGYTDLKRGDSVGAYSHPTSAGYGQGHEQYPPQQPHSQQGQGEYGDFPESGNYLGRPTGGAEGPYAQAAQYRY